MSKHSYTEIEFKNAPDHKTTPLNATNLNHIEEGITNAFTDISDTQEAIAPVESTLTASQAYAIGDQFIYENVLYKATAAISAGGSISINGNCSAADTIVEQLAAVGDKGYVEVTADGVKTISALLDQLHSLINFSKLGKDSCLETIIGTTHDYFSFTSQNSTQAVFLRPQMGTSDIVVYEFVVKASGSLNDLHTLSNYLDYSATILTSGSKIRVYY